MALNLYFDDCADITKNPGDFQALHAQNPNHHAIFAVYQDNDVMKDMEEADIVAAIARIETANLDCGRPVGQAFLPAFWQAA